MSQKRKKKERKGVEIKEVSKRIVERENIGFWQIIKKNWIFTVLLMVGTVLLYFNGMNGNFVSDDYATIPQFADVTNFAIQSKQISLPTWSNWLVASLFGNQNPTPFHWFSLMLTLGAILMAFVLVYLLFDVRMAMVASIIFATMPIHVEGTTWISGKPYSFNALFVLWAMVISLLYVKTRKKFYAIYLFLLLPWVFLADKVRFFSYFFLMGLVWISFPQNFKFNVNWKKVGTIFLIILIPAIVYLIPKIGERINIVNSGYNSSESVFYDPFFQYPTSIAKYLQLQWAPVDLTLYHTMYTFPSWLNWAIMMVYLLALGYFFFKNKKIFFALAFIFLAAAPSMAPVKVSWLVAERYMFLGSVGFSLFLALLFWEGFYRIKIVAVTLLVAFVGLGIVQTYIRSDDWTTNHKLWAKTCQVSPNSHNAWNNIGDDYDKLAMAATDNNEKIRQFGNAIKGFTQSTIVKPNYADAYHNRANIFYKVGRFDLARESYNTALSFSPGLYQTYLSLTQIDLTEQKYGQAMKDIEAGMKIDPNNPQMAYILGVAYAQMGKLDQAKAVFQQILSVYPNYNLASDALKKLAPPIK